MGAVEIPKSPHGRASIEDLSFRKAPENEHLIHVRIVWGDSSVPFYMGVSKRFAVLQHSSIWEPSLLNFAGAV